MIPEPNLFIEHDASALLALGALSAPRMNQMAAVLGRAYQFIPSLEFRMIEAHEELELRRSKQQESRQRLRYL